MRPTSAISSVQPGTSTKRTQMGSLAAAGRREHLEDKFMLHQWLAPANGQAAAHGMEAVTIFPDLLDRSRERHRDSIRHFPRIRVVAVGTFELAAAQPRDDTDSGAIDRGA